MKRAITIAMIPLLAFAGISCTTAPTREQTGTVVGGVLGGVLGSQVGKGTGREAAIIAGTLVGAMIGGSVGRSMDDVDRMTTAQVLESNQDRQPTTWTNPNTGYTYTAMPTNTYRTETGPCREYQMDAIIGGKPSKVYGTACRQPDGSWKVVN